MAATAIHFLFMTSHHYNDYKYNFDSDNNSKHKITSDVLSIKKFNCISK